MLLAFYALLLVVTVSLQIVFDGRVGSLFSPSPVGPVEVDVALGVVVGLVLVRLSQWAAQRLRGFRDMADALGEMLAPMTPRDVFGQALFSALAEELLFRGFLQPRLGLHATAILFGVVHLPRDRRLRLWQPLGIALGYLLGWMFEARGSIVAPVLTHFIVNYFNMHFMMASRSDAPTTAQPSARA
jgi:membrane protease YdiL (CAAX protease family)